MLQYGRLFGKTFGLEDFVGQPKISSIRMMARWERILRILISWILLVLAKSIALASPLFFRSLIEKAAFLDKSMPVGSFNEKQSISQAIELSIQSLMQVSALGLMIGYGATKLASGFVQLTSELILSPVTTTVSEILPQQVSMDRKRSPIAH